MANNINKIYKYSIRKFKVGVGSAIVGLGLVFAGQEAFASEGETVVEQEVAQVAAGQEVTTKVEVPAREESVPSEVSSVENLKVSENSKTEVEKEGVENIVAPPVEDKIEVASSVVTANNQEVTDIVTATKDSFKDDKLEDRYAELNVRERPLDKLSIRTAIAKERQTNITNVPETDPEVVSRVQKFYLDKLTLDETYKETKANIESELTQVLNNTTIADKNAVTKDISNNSGQILTGLAYLNRYYSFEFPDGKTAKDIILEVPNALETVKAIGRSTYSELGANMTHTTFERKIGPRIGHTSLTDFIDAKVGANVDDWYVNTSKAIIVEEKSKESNINSRLYTKLKSNDKLKSHILPLLSLTDESIYAISTMTSVQFGLTDTYIPKENGTYKTEDLEKLKATVKKVAEEQGRYLDTWYRIVDEKTKPKLDRAVISIDTMQRYSTDPNSTSRTRWASDSGLNSTSGIREFMSPLGHYAQFTQANGEAVGEGMRFYMMKALTPEGNSTYSHEMTHILEDMVWFNGEVSRDGLNTEVFARGLFEVLDNTQDNNTYDPVFNLNFLYDLTGKDKRIQNEVPERFQTVDDLKIYMSGVFDVLYTLDYAEAEVALTKSNDEKAIWFNKIKPETAPANDRNKDLHVNDNFVNITNDEAARLTDINSLVDNDIVAGRYRYKGVNTTGVALGDQANSYYVVPMFEPIYAAMQNSNGVTGDVSVRRQAYELLAEYGYRDGVIPYITNQLKNEANLTNQKFSDDFVFGKIMPEHQGDFATFKKAMFQRRIDKVNNLKPVTIDYAGKKVEITTFNQIMELMKSAVVNDLAVMRTNPSSDKARNVTAVQDLKEAIFRAYLKDTKDFSESIYREPLANTNEPTTSPVRASWINGYVAPSDDLVKNAVTIDNKLVKSKEIVPAETTESEVVVLVTYTDDSTDKVRVPVSIDPVTKQETTARSTRFERNDNLDFGQRETVVGKDGSFENVFTYVLENGRFVEKVNKQNEVVAIDDLIKVGTKAKIETKVLPKGIEYQADQTKDFGFIETKEVGKDGQEVRTTTYDMDAQGNVSENPVQVTRTEAINTVVVKGTKPATRVEENPFTVNRVESADLKKGTEKIKTKGQNEIVNYVTTYTLDQRTGEIVPTVTRTVIQEKIDEVLLIGILETSKGEPAFQDGLEPLVIPDKPVFEKGEPLKEEEKPTLELPKGESSKGSGQQVDAKPEVEIKQEVPSDAPTVEEKPRLELLKIENAKGSGQQVDAKPEVEIKQEVPSDAPTVEEKPRLELPKEENTKGSGQQVDAKPEVEIKQEVPSDAPTVEEKPRLELPKIETSKGGSLVRENLPILEFPFVSYKGEALIQNEKPKVELKDTSVAKERKVILEKIQKLESTEKKVTEKVLPKTSSVNNGANMNMSLALPSILILTGLMTRRKEK